MRYTKQALLLFGAGLLLGLAVVSANLWFFAPAASLTMAASLLALPVALVADWWSYRPWHRPKGTRPRRRAKPPQSKKRPK